VPYDLPTETELQETVQKVRDLNQACIGIVADVRSADQMKNVVSRTLEEFERLDILVANAGIISYARAWELTDEQWQSVLDVNLTGVWQACKP
jgi:NAD(P)-dependent dehydrogenase (short-subunit alcohol dehydrogenase family)